MQAKPVQIRLTNSETMGHSIRSMTSSQISKLVGLSGIVIAASRVKAKATTVSMQCRSCGFVKTLSVRPVRQPCPPSVLPASFQL